MAGTQQYPYTLDSAGDAVLASQTLLPGGPAITVGGETIAEASDGASVVIVSGGVTRTEALSQFIIPTGSASYIDGYMTGVVNAGVNGGAIASLGTAAGGPSANSAAATTIPMINPTSARTSAVRSEAGRLGRRWPLRVVLMGLVGWMIGCGWLGT